MKQVHVDDDALGTAVKETMEKHKVDSYIMVSLDDTKHGATILAVDDLGKAVTMINLLFNAVPELFTMFFQTVFASYLDMLRGVLSGKGELPDGVAPKAKDSVDMSDYIKGVKF